MNSWIPANEQERLAALRSYAILDTPPEQVFDRITNLAARIFNVPIATMSLIDERRQWFKSCHGLDISETPRELAFCSHAILSDEVLVIADASSDARFAAHPLVTGKPYIRFYAGAPLTSAGGLKLGTLCLIDTKPREFTETDRLTLADLAALLMDQLQFRQAATDVQRSEAKFRALIENAQDIISVVSPNGKILFESPAVERVLGLRPEEMVGHNAFDFVHPDDHAEVRGTFQEALRTGASDGEFRFRHKDGSYRWLEAVGSYRSGESAVGGVVINSRDVTERREAEQRLRLLESVAVNARDAILIGDLAPPEGDGPRIIYVNEAFTKITGYTRDEVIGRSPDILHGPKTDSERLQQARLALRAREPSLLEVINYHKNGHELWMELSIVPVAGPKGSWTYWVTIGRDITERKRIEAALRAANEQSEQANRAKSEFLSRMSHELRTPLNAIIGFAQLLEPNVTSAEDQESLEQILKAGRHLLRLINEVLDITRIESGGMALSIEPVDLDEAVQEAVETMRPLTIAQGIVLQAATCGRFALADRQRLKQVLLNLLSNAIRYNRSGGSVSVQCSAIAADLGSGLGERLRVTVADTGRGIASERLSRLFEPFERLQASGSGIEGIGLGLAVCKRLIALMGGDIGVESTVDIGSAFWFELPATDNPVERYERASAEPVSSAHAGPAMTILYIEDNLSNLRLIERVLSRQPGVKLLAAMQGELGIELAVQHQPELILLDLHLPDTDGSIVLERLMKNEATKHIPVVIISADATAGQVKRLLAAGAKAYLTKPIDIPEILRLVRETLESISPRTASNGVE